MFTIEELKRFPTDAGVYLMKNNEGKVLYVGKAKNLRVRVKQYFMPSGDDRPIIPFLVAEVASIDTIVVTSEKEALILENNLIKKHFPKYNALLKDDKTYCSLMINHKHMWPMIRMVRFLGKPPKGALYFGPYTKSLAARETLELMRSLFPLRQCSDSELVRRTRPCILYDLKRCIAPCVAKCTKEEYDHVVSRAIDFLRGHDKSILKELKEEMQKASDNLEFERAAILLQKIRSIEATLEKQRVEKAAMIDLDVLAIYRNLDEVVLTQMLFREGKLIASNDYLFAHNAQEDDEVLTSFILQHYEEKDFPPQEIVVPFDFKDKEALFSLLNIKIHIPKKGDKLALLEMAKKNAEAFFMRRKEKHVRQEKLLMTLEEELRLTNFPEVIECIDTSNISGSETVSSMVVFTHGERTPSQYRKYKIKTAGPSDDYGALKEVLTRRYSKAKEEDNLPDLILIDGGRGHLNLAIKVLSDLDVSTVDVISISKEQGKHTKGMTEELIHTKYLDEPIHFESTSLLLHFLQKIRDEAHRTAITFQRKRRKKKTLGSALDELTGIGPIKKKRLLLHFGSFEGIKKATPKELLKIPGITKKDVDTLKKISE